MIEHGFCEYYKISSIFEHSSFSHSDDSECGYMFCDFEDPVSVLLFYTVYSCDMIWDPVDMRDDIKHVLMKLHSCCYSKSDSFDDICNRASNESGYSEKLLKYLYDNVDLVMDALRKNSIEITEYGSIRRVRA